MLIFYCDGQPQLQANHGQNVPGQLRSLFERMDADMDQGVELDQGFVADPDDDQRRQFVVAQLIAAFEAGKRDFAQTLVTYLARRWPALKAVHADTQGESWTVHLEFG